MGGRMPATISKLDPLSQPEYWAGRAMANRMSDTTPNIYVNSNEGTMDTNSCSKLDTPSLGMGGGGSCPARKGIFTIGKETKILEHF